MKHTEVFISAFGRPRVELPEDAEIWTLNNWPIKRPDLKPTRVYEIHGNKFLNTTTRYPKNFKEFHNNIEVITLENYGFNNERVFNIDTAIKKYGPELFTSTLCYMLHDAVEEKFNLIVFDGVELFLGEHNEEYTEQMPAVKQWIEIARNENIEVVSFWEKNWVVPEDYVPMIYGAKDIVQKYCDEYDIKMSPRCY